MKPQYFKKYVTETEVGRMDNEQAEGRRTSNRCKLNAQLNSPCASDTKGKKYWILM